jgi:hypothetical protein
MRVGTRRSDVALCVILALSGCGTDRESDKKWPPVVLANHFSCTQAPQDVDLACGFLLKHGDRTYAVTAKHVLSALSLKGVKGLDILSLEGVIREWSMFSKENRSELVTLGPLLNENRSESIRLGPVADEDWVVLEIKANRSHVRPLETRKTPLKAGERLYVVGWTNLQTGGPQRTYEYEYAKTLGTRILLKEVLVPSKIGGLSGAPVIDENGLVVGLVSNSTLDPETGKKYFSPCTLVNLEAFLDSHSASDQ